MRILIISAILFSGVVIIPIDDGGESPRMFHSIEISPYEKNNSFSIDINYHSPLLEQTLLQVTITNTKYNEQIIYARSINVIGNFSTSIMIYPYLIDDYYSCIGLYAYGNNFNVVQDIMIYPQKEFIIDQFVIEDEQIFNGSVSKSLITSSGVSEYQYEQISFINFNGYIEHDYYLRLELEQLKLRIEPNDYPSSQTMLGYLYIHDPDNYFPYIHQNDDKKEVAIVLIGDDDCYKFDFYPSLYVEPLMLLTSQQNYQGFVLSSYFYMPINRFEQLKIIEMEIKFTLQLQHIYHVNYSFQYYANRRLFGNCSNSLYCVETIEGPNDVGYEQWQELSNG
jgi:hypothetical protein